MAVQCIRNSRPSKGGSQPAQLGPTWKKPKSFGKAENRALTEQPVQQVDKEQGSRLVHCQHSCPGWHSCGIPCNRCSSLFSEWLQWALSHLPSKWHCMAVTDSSMEVSPYSGIVFKRKEKLETAYQRELIVVIDYCPKSSHLILITLRTRLIKFAVPSSTHQQCVCMQVCARACWRDAVLHVHCCCASPCLYPQCTMQAGSFFSSRSF